MVRDTCEVCGYRSQLGAIEKHHIVPIEITEQALMPLSETISMCCNCHRELHQWFSIKVNDMIYDAKLQKIRYRTPAEMVKEYHSVFNGFKKHKEEQKKTT